MRPLTWQEIEYIFGNLCEILNLKAVLLTPSPERSEEFNLYFDRCEKSMIGFARAEAFPLGGKYGAVIVSRNGIYEEYKNYGRSAWRSDKFFVPFTPWCLIQAYAFTITHELVHIQEFTAANRINQEPIDIKVAEDLFIKRGKGFDKYFGGFQGANELVDELGLGKDHHNEDFYSTYSESLGKTIRWIRDLDDPWFRTLDDHDDG